MMRSFEMDGNQYAIATQHPEVGMRFEPIAERDEAAQDRFDPPIDHLVKGIMLEIAEERMYGRLKPFVEGEPIGVLPRLVLKRLTQQQREREHNAHKEREREAMLDRRARNNKLLKEWS